MAETSDKVDLPLPAIAETVSALVMPSLTWRYEALQGEKSAERHRALRAQCPALNTLRLRQPVLADPPGNTVRVLSWNLERCKHVEGTSDLIRKHAPQICLLTEMDLGMARSENRDTTAEVAGELGMGHVFGTEFVELGHGDLREQDLHKGTPNLHGLHGNAVLTHLPIAEAHVLPLDNTGFWFWSDDCGDQRRIGGRIAIAVRHEMPRPFWVVSVHFESRLSAVERAEEARVMLAHLERLAGEEPVLIGGDFNTANLDHRKVSPADILERPQDYEPMFDVMGEAGFSWETANLPDVTLRCHPWTPHRADLALKIDWFFLKGLMSSGPETIPAVDLGGKNLSDHEAIALTLSFDPEIPSE